MALEAALVALAREPETVTPFAVLVLLLFIFSGPSNRSIEDHDRLDEVAGFVLHQQQGFLHVLKAVEAMRDERQGIETAGLQQRGQLLHAQAAAGSGRLRWSLWPCRSPIPRAG